MILVAEPIHKSRHLRAGAINYLLDFKPWSLKLGNKSVGSTVFSMVLLNWFLHTLCMCNSIHFIPPLPDTLIKSWELRPINPFLRVGNRLN